MRIASGKHHESKWVKLGRIHDNGFRLQGNKVRGRTSISTLILEFESSQSILQDFPTEIWMPVIYVCPFLIVKSLIPSTKPDDCLTLYQACLERRSLLLVQGGILVSNINVIENIDGFAKSL